MGHSAEPSVEEILESIKQVIARDNRAGAAETRRLRETRGMAEDGAGEDILDLATEALFLDEDADQAESGSSDDDEPLINEAAQSGMRDSLAALAMLAHPGAPPQIVRSGETSIESLVRELLRPALAEWLDKNLPPLVERMVADEIRRISAHKG